MELLVDVDVVATGDVVDVVEDVAHQGVAGELLAPSSLGEPIADPSDSQWRPQGFLFRWTWWRRILLARLGRFPRWTWTRLKLGFGVFRGCVRWTKLVGFPLFAISLSWGSW